MLVITKKIKMILEAKNLSENMLSKMIVYHSGSLNKIINGQESFPKHLITKIAPILEVSVCDIESWILTDKYPKEVLELALKAKKEYTEEGKLILTSKIDELLKSKNLSRTALSKIIKYSQGKLNEMIIGKEPMSKLVINKVASAMAVSEDEITSWIVSDKYSIEVIELAIKHF